MSEKRFTIHKENMYKEEWYDYPFCIKEDEEVRIHIDKEKREEIESKYGVSYHYTSRLLLSDDEIQFKENYLTTEYGNVPYEIINKIEVVEK